MQLVHEAAVCTTGIRAERTLHKRGGFELVNGLPFVASDQAIHHLLNERTVSDSMCLQVALGKIRLASGCFRGKVLAIDPHRVRAHSKRRMRKRPQQTGQRAVKTSQTFWVLDADTHQPVCFTTGTSARSVTDATPELMDLAHSILHPESGSTLVIADSEHLSGILVDEVHHRTGFDLLIPLPNRANYRKKFREIPEEQFAPRWAGYATAKISHKMRRGGQYYHLVQRNGECPDEWVFNGFMSTSDSDEVEAMSRQYPKRWHIEEFFNANQALGWKRSGTQNLNIRYGQMTMALIAQAAIHQLRKRLGQPFSSWDANHLSKELFSCLDGDIRVTHDTILVTYYNAPNTERLRFHYEGLPYKLQREGIAPEIPWLYNYKIDFRFR